MKKNTIEKILINFWNLRYKPIDILYPQFLNFLLDYLNENNIILTKDNFITVIENLDKYIIQKLSKCTNC